MSSHIILENSQRFNNNDMSENEKKGGSNIFCSGMREGVMEVSSELGARGTTELLKRLGNHTPKNAHCMQKSLIYKVLTIIFFPLLVI